MKQKVKKQWMRTLGMALAAAFLLFQPMTEVQAAGNEDLGSDDSEGLVIVRELTEEELAAMPSVYTMLINCSIVIGCESDGLVVDIATGASQTASSLGIKNIKIEQKKWYGWKLVATAEDVEVQNRASLGISLLYTGAEYGETYRVSCVHYGTVDSYTEEENVTPGVVYKY